VLDGLALELVLRRGDGSFYSTPHLINVLCHEVRQLSLAQAAWLILTVHSKMSHILHMHHGPSFWAYYHELKREVQALQRAKYFGDGVYYEAHYTIKMGPHGIERLLVVWSST
jgi:DNA-dependent metalloprotease WSS1